MFSDNPGKSMNGKIKTNTPSMSIIKITSKIKAPSQYVVFLQPMTVNAYLSCVSLSITGEAAIPAMVKQYESN